VTGILIVLSFLFPISAIIDYTDAFPRVKHYRVEQIIVIAIIGGLLIYTLRDKKN